MEIRVVIFWLLISSIVGVIAYVKGRNWFGWFLLSLIISPLVSFIFLFIVKKLEPLEKTAPKETKTVKDNMPKTIPVEKAPDHQNVEILNGIKMSDFVKLNDMCQKFSGRADEYYVDPIPARKIAGARESLRVPNSAQIVALIDFTTFGSAKDALVVSDTGLYWKTQSLSPCHISWCQLQQSMLCETKPNMFIKVIELGNGLKIEVNGRFAQEKNHFVFDLINLIKIIISEDVPVKDVPIENVPVEEETLVNSDTSDVDNLMVCEFCQKKNKPDVTFCKSCGIKIRG